MIIFPEGWGREIAANIERHHAKNRAERLAFLRHRLQTPMPSFMVRPGMRECWRDEDAKIVQSHVENLAALLKLSNMAREDYPDALALKAALILHSPLLEAGPGALGTLGLHPRLFVGVVEAFDRQQANTQGKEST